MKLWFTYSLAFISGLIVIIMLLSFSTNPEEIIVGKWDEVTWQYEQQEISLEEKELIGKLSQNFLIHEAEKWNFEPDGTLLLTTDKGEVKKAWWRIKGRGHILQIRYSEDYTENYNIDVLTNDSLVINFEDSIEIRGISKLTFNRLTN